MNALEHSPPDAPGAPPHSHFGLSAFLIYLGISLVFFGTPLAGHFTTLHHGTGEDPTIGMWNVVWWPYALIHGINPLFTKYLWAPIGINLAWVVTLPLPSFLMWPVTAAIGPVGSWNIECLLAPPLAAWAAFLLCRRAVKSWWPALLGGYLFGFSTYLIGHLLIGTLQLTLIVLLPLAALAAIRAIAGEISAPKFIFLLAAIAAAQFLISIEILAGMTMFGAIALALAWWFAPPDISRRIGRLTLPIAGAYAIAALIVSPYLYWLFAFGSPHGAVWPGWTETYSANLLSVLLPSPINECGLIPPFGKLWAYFAPHGWFMNATYIGLPPLAVAAAYAWRDWRTPLGKTLLAFFAIATLLSMGPRLHLTHDIPLFPLPTKYLLALPIIDKILPYRYLMYSSLALAIIAALWFASNQLSRPVNLVLAAIVVLFTMPSLSFPWVRPANQPAFFTGGMYRKYLRRGENVLVIPYGWRGDSMLWQAESNMYFRMVGGWTGLYPKEFDEWPVFHAFLFTTYLPDAEEQLGAFMAHHQVTAAVVADDDPDAVPWKPILANFSSDVHAAGGVTIYRLLPSTLKPYSHISASIMRRRAATATIESLLAAAGGWLAAGHRLAQLDPAKAAAAGLLKDSWCTGRVTDSATGKRLAVVDAAHHWFCGVEIGGTPQGNVMIGAPGAYGEFLPVIDRYRNAAMHIYFPFPRDLLKPGMPAPPPRERAFLRMEFSPAQVAAIAAYRSPGQSK
ncbi:MAG: hypothetical protein ACREQI_03530 [Candidatus Binataceae bacterium]